MASLNSRVDAVKAAVSSTTTCTPTTTVTLRDLLLPGSAVESSSSAAATKQATNRAPPKSSSRTNKVGKAVRSDGNGKEEGLSVREKEILATHIINSALRSLQEAARPQPPPQTPSKRPSPAGHLRRTSSGTSLRRSISSPLSPVQPRSLNRTATIDAASTKSTRCSTPVSSSTGCLSTVECARVAFMCLRSLAGSSQSCQKELQIEMGMSAFVSKLIALGLQDQALKELRVLKRRLEEGGVGEGTKKTAKSGSSDAVSVARVISELLDFKESSIKPSTRDLITAAQLHALRLISLSKKPEQIEGTLQYLRESHASSPLNILLECAQKEVTKTARQLDKLASLILSLLPSSSGKIDGEAMERRLSPSPTAVFELHTIAMKTRLHSWRISGHRGDVDKDILSPFSRYLAAFGRRLKPVPSSAHGLCRSATHDLSAMIQELELAPSESLKSPMAAIYQSLGSSALSLKLNEEAREWVEKLHGLLDVEKDSSVRRCSLTCQLLAVRLKGSFNETEVTPLLKEVIEGVQGTFRGESTELDQLMADLSMARRSAVGILATWYEQQAGRRVSRDFAQLLESLIVLYPRFTSRWLGKAPARGSDTKDFIRFENRRQTVVGTLRQMLDSVLVVSKAQIKGKVEWSKLDGVLQDCLELLERVGDAKTLSPTSNGNSYHAKVSHLYYMEHALTRQDSDDPKDLTPLRALRRSIDAIRDRSPKEKEAAQFVSKLERFSDICVGFGRIEEGRDALQSICTSMVEEGVLSRVAAALGEQPPTVAWSIDERTELLSRTLCSITKMDKSWNDWTFFLPEVERAAILEHLMHLILSGSGANKKREPLKTTDPLVDTLLRIYSVEKFPVRRLRTLLHLFSMNMTHLEESIALRGLVETCMQAVETKSFGEDGSLSQFVPHLKGYFASLSMLLDWNPHNADFQSAMGLWRAVADSTTTRDDILKRIDNPPTLLTHLKAMVDLANMKGENSLLLCLLELLGDLSKKMAESALDEAVSCNSLLATHYVSLGYVKKAEKVLESLRALSGQQDMVSGDVMTGFHLASAEYSLAVGSLDKAEHYLAEAKAAFHADSSHKSSKPGNSSLAAMAGYIYSIVALEKGESQPALSYARESVTTLFHDWVKLEGRASKQRKLDCSVMDRSIECNESVGDTSTVVHGSDFWALTYPLLRSILRLSAVHAHMGMFQETLYYAEQACAVAKSSGSPLYVAQTAAWAGSVWTKAGSPAKALPFMVDAEDFVTRNPNKSQSVELACQLSDLYREMGDSETEAHLLRLAEESVGRLGEEALKSNSDGAVAEAATAMERLALTETRSRATTRTTRTTRTKAPAAKKPAARKPPAASRSKAAAAAAAAAAKPTPAIEDTHVAGMRASILLYRALGYMQQKEWAQAMAALEEAKTLQFKPGDGYGFHGQVVLATCLLGQSMDDMMHDPVFSVVQDSTISFPAVAKRADHSGSDRHSVSKSQSPQQRKPSRDGATGKFVDSLKEAQDQLLEANSVAIIRGDGGFLHRISSLLQSTVIFLSATSTSTSTSTSARTRIMGHPAYATCAVELARNVTWRRERKALQVRSATTEDWQWPAALPMTDPRRSSLGFTTDISRFQRDYIDIIPPTWSVVSVSPSDNKQDLCITKLQAGHSPFVLRLPLDRANSRDADTEIFNLEHGLGELKELIARANKSSHDARDMTTKGAKLAWWEEREVLDQRFKELVENMESVWLGGFRGIFSQHQRRTDLLARFQKSFHAILSKSLPSRQPSRGRRAAKAATPIAFDPRILDLFIGLGDPDGQDVDLEEELTDLLYFVVDILQFHGERNAYDEIDFDCMVVETLDALRGYHQAVKSSGEKDEDRHTVLVLDKSLHAFPWESLPCMQGLAVSRVPSLACLRRLVLEQGAPVDNGMELDDPQPKTTTHPPGHYVSPASGTYVLNPGSDLAATTSTFSAPLSALPNWTPIVSRVPTEAEFEESLASNDVFLYFGHGSGQQYIRGKTIRRMDKCRSTVFLMGCSSASLESAGEFEPYGAVWNYMLAGCPAVVGALWDVTDREVDRLAGRVFEEWGLFERGTFQAAQIKGKERARSKSPTKRDGKGKGRAKVDGGGGGGGWSASEEGCSLVEAVARGRDACRFRYLTAAAVCVYGIPVYIKRE